MKKRELERALKALGWYLDREGASHEVWTNGESFESVSRSREINEQTAKAILRRARKASGKR